MNTKYYILLVAVLFFACNQNEPEATAMPESDEATTLQISDVEANKKVQIGAVQTRSVSETIRCTGRIEIPPTDLVSIHSKMEGHITYLKYLSSDYVQKGTLLVEIENPQLLEKQRIMMETKANLDFAEKDLNRKQALKTGNAVSDKTFDETQNRYALLKATYDGLKAELRLYGVNVEALENENRYQSKVQIYAPVSGAIHEVGVNMGQRILPETKLMDIANDAHLHLELQVLAKDSDGLKKGQSVQFTLPSSKRIFQAEIVKINPMLDAESGTIEAHCHLKNNSNELIRAGQFAQATIQKGTSDQQGLPLSATVKIAEEYYGYQLKGNVFEQVLLNDATVVDEFITWTGDKSGTWIVDGAYYVE